MRIRIALTMCVALALVVTACGDSPASGGTGSPSAQGHGPHLLIEQNWSNPSPTLSAGLAAALPYLQLTIDAPNPVRQGESLGAVLALRNVGQKSLTVALGGVPPDDFVVRDGSGAIVWSANANKGILLPITLQKIVPGGVILYETEWNLTDNRGNLVAPGKYTITGVLNGDPPWVFETDASDVQVQPPEEYQPGVTVTPAQTPGTPTTSGQTRPPSTPFPTPIQSVAKKED